MKKPKKTIKPTAYGGGLRLKNDVVWISVLLFVIFAAGLFFFVTRDTGNTVLVTVEGEFFAEYPLAEDRRVEIARDGHINILVVQNGEAYVEWANCPDGICSSHKPIRYSGESIICLPNQVVISVYAEKKTEQPDVLS